jgi:hypothetical protein
MAEKKKKPLTLWQLVGAIGRHIELNPEDADKLVLSTTECGHVHEYIRWGREGGERRGLSRRGGLGCRRVKPRCP